MPVAGQRLLAAPLFGSAAVAQTAGDPQRETTRQRLSGFLATAGPRNDVNIAFHQSDKNPWNFAGVARGGFANCDYLEVVIGISTQNTIAITVYPHYHGNYINAARAKDPGGLSKKLLNLSYHNFYHFGSDDGGDIFAGYNFTLESGFPEQSMLVALTSIRSQDQFIAALAPFIGS